MGGGGPQLLFCLCYGASFLLAYGRFLGKSGPNRAGCVTSICDSQAEVELRNGKRETVKFLKDTFRVIHRLLHEIQREMNSRIGRRIRVKFFWQCSP